MNYDNWKQKTPDEDDLENECLFCGAPCDETYCSNECKKMDIE